ncbi:hypothetical protein FB451DRAFT_1537719 [Mycena latifolia]|nr:hypothetical protein FB451DRAFT_1537719 [Mycena latifolia]
MALSDGGAQTSALNLPYELTSQIFVYCLPHHHRWRAVALATPKLWSSIYLEFPTGHPYDGIPALLGISNAEPVRDHTCELLESWLTRAAGYPVSIALICVDGGIEVPKDLMPIVAAHSAHWGRIELKITNQDVADFNKIPGPFPMLRSLAISASNDHSTLLPINAIHCSPNLKALHLSDTFKFSGAVALPNLAAMSASLTVLEIVDLSHRSTFNDFLRVCEHFPHLTHLGVGYWNITLNAIIIPRLMPSLRSLSMTRAPTQLLRLVDIPTLEHLEVRVSWSPDSIHLVEFLSRSAGRLYHLAIHLFSSPDDQFLSQLAVAASLTTLELFLPDARARVIDARYQFLQPRVLPHLRTLKITDDLHRATYAPFLAVLRVQPALTRAELHMRSRHANVRWRMGLPHRELLAEFEALAVQGLRIRITTPSSVWPRSVHADDDDALATHDEIGGFLREFYSHY